MSNGEDAEGDEEMKNPARSRPDREEGVLFSLEEEKVKPKSTTFLVSIGGRRRIGRAEQPGVMMSMIPTSRSFFNSTKYIYIYIYVFFIYLMLSNFQSRQFEISSHQSAPLDRASSQHSYPPHSLTGPSARRSWLNIIGCTLLHHHPHTIQIPTWGSSNGSWR